MSERFEKYCINGTAALNAHAANPRNCTAVIIPFPQRQPPSAPAKKVAPCNTPSSSGRKQIVGEFSRRLQSALRSSEMACSLVREDYHGVAYGLFGKNQLALFAAAGILVAAVALAFGA